jgi:AcrR family transcriptional regulator
VTAPRQRRSREQQRAQTRERLLDAAAEVVAARGLEGASIDEISDRAGYTRGAFYSNFSGKPELLVELCELRLRRYAERIVPIINATPEQDRVARAARLLMQREPDVDILLLVELARLRATNDEVAALLERFAGRFTDLVDEVLAASPDLGDPTPEQRRAGARGLVGALLGLAFLQHLGVADVATAELLLEGVGRAAFPDAREPGAPGPGPVGP